MSGNIFDYIIVGAGSAGCVLANRLSSQADLSILLIEAGPADKSLSLKIPAAMAANLKSTKYNWAFQGEPEKELNGRIIQHDRGKTLGGSSSINGMVFIRGHAMDFDNWRQMGCEGWSYREVLPYFKRMETYSGGEDAYRGSEGPLHVQRPSPTNPITQAFLEAGSQAGYPATDDICGYRQEGFGLLDRTTYNGERWSAVRAYLDPARKRPNLTIMTDTQVEGIGFDRGRAKNIKFRNRKQELTTITAEREIILCAGAVGTPHILMLSGIGPSKHLHDKGIDCRVDLSGVGANLNEHPDFVVKLKCKQPVSIWPKTRPLARTAAGIQWLLNKKGVCASNHFEAVACIRSSSDIDYPDLQLTISPIAMHDDSWNPIQGHAFQIHVGLMRAYSRGRIELRNADPLSPPQIRVNYLQDKRDRDRLRRGVRMVRELLDQPAFADLRGEEIFPGKNAKSDEDLDKHLNENVATQWHLSGTCRMGSSNDLGAVVDSTGQVYGVDGLRVIDASIMPQVTNGNTNSPTIMIAEKLSDAVLGKSPLKPIDVSVWQNPEIAAS